jgi:hypothetical protein
MAWRQEDKGQVAPAHGNRAKMMVGSAFFGLNIVAVGIIRNVSAIL